MPPEPPQPAHGGVLLGGSGLTPPSLTRGDGKGRMGPFVGVGFADNQDFSGGADSAQLFLPPPPLLQQQPGVSQLHIPFPGKWDLYISRRLQATVIMVGFLGGGI